MVRSRQEMHHRENFRKDLVVLVLFVETGCPYLPLSSPSSLRSSTLTVLWSPRWNSSSLTR